MTDVERPVHDPTTETTSTPTPTVPVGGVAVPPAAAPAAGPVSASAAKRPSRARWAVAAVVVALVVGASAVAAFMLTGASAQGSVVGYVPADSVAYGEVRLDLPGDQRAEVGEFLSKFPGFADQAALDTKLDEVLDRLVSEATDGTQTFTADIKPWFDGEVAFAMGPLPQTRAIDDPAIAAQETRALLLLSVKDAALATAWFNDVMAETGVTGTTETYGDAQLTVFSDPDMRGVQAAFAIVDGKVAIAGDLASVKAAVDTNGTNGLSGDPAFEAALSAAPGDHIGFLYVDLQALVLSAQAMTEGLSGSEPNAIGTAVLELVPEWASSRLRIEGDAIVLDNATPHVDGAPGPDDNHANGVAAYAPPTTLLLAAGNDAGATFRESLDRFRDDPALGDGIKSLEESAGLFGGLDPALAWLGDTGVVIAPAGDSVEGGLVSIPADAAAAKQFLTTIRSLLTLAGGQQGITVTDQDYAGTTITTVDLGSISSLAGLVGAPSDLEAFGGSLPDGNAQISYAATDAVVVIGSGPDFVKHVLDAGAGESLADTSRYQGLIGRVGAEHTGVTFVDIAALRTHLEGALANATAEERAEYEESLKPFLTPFDAFIAAGVTSPDLEQQHALITVK